MWYNILCNKHYKTNNKVRFSLPRLHDFFSSDNISLKGGIQGLIQELADTKKNPQKHKPKKHAAKTYTGTTYIT